MSVLPYTTATGNIEKALNGIKSAATPDKVSQDFVKTILKIKGGSGNQITSFFKKIGFANSDGTPTTLYKKFRNSQTSGEAVAQALKKGYGALYTRNEYMHTLTDDELKGLIIEETGQSEDSKVVGFVLSSINILKKFASFAENTDEQESPEDPPPPPPIDPTKLPSEIKPGKVGLNLSYTINLNLPATSDIAVFNAIFKSLKENLLRDTDE